MARVLYITYDGLMEPLGMSQVWQYLKVLSKNNTITIISFEKSADFLDKVMVFLGIDSNITKLLA